MKSGVISIEWCVDVFPGVVLAKEADAGFDFRPQAIGLKVFLR